MALLRIGACLATAAFRRESNCLSYDSFSSNVPISSDINDANPPTPPPRTKSESISQRLSHIKLHLRCKNVVLAALDVELYSDAIRHFSKVVDGPRGAPQGFLRSATCTSLRLTDCNRALAVDPTCIQAISTASLLETTLRCGF